MNSRREVAAAAVAMAGLVPWPTAGAVEPLPVPPPIGGVLWTVVVPILLFAVSFLAAYALYRHFSGE